MAKLIELTGKFAVEPYRFAIVDDERYEHLNQWRWHVKPGRRTAYAWRGGSIEGKKVQIKMHRYILGLFNGDKGQVDHRDRNGLNNQRDNLRIATRRENRANVDIDTIPGICKTCGLGFLIERLAGGPANSYCSKSCRRMARFCLDTEVGRNLERKIIEASRDPADARRIAALSGINLISVWSLLPRMVKSGSLLHLSGRGGRKGKFIYQAPS